MGVPAGHIEVGRAVAPFGFVAVVGGSGVVNAGGEVAVVVVVVGVRSGEREENERVKGRREDALRWRQVRQIIVMLGELDGCILGLVFGDGDIFWETCSTVAGRGGCGSQYKVRKVENTDHVEQSTKQEAEKR